MAVLTRTFSMRSRATQSAIYASKLGQLKGFEFDGDTFPLHPKSAFYDWLYANAIFPERQWLRQLSKLDGFTDIEFNPEKSVNCQARSCAFFVALEKRDMLDNAMSSFRTFVSLQQDTAL